MKVELLTDAEITQAKIFMIEVMNESAYGSEEFLNAEEAYMDLYEEEVIRNEYMEAV